MENRLPKIFLKSRELAFDMDDVLVSFAAAINTEMNRVAEQATVENYVTYAFNEYHGVSYEQFRDLILDNDLFRTLQPFDGAINALSILASKGFRIHIVTARDGFEGAREVTQDWIGNHNAPVSSLTVMGKEKNYSKSFYYNEFNAAIIVDDASHNIIDAVENGNGVVPFIVTRPWNANDERINELVEAGKVYRIACVTELTDAFELDPAVSQLQEVA
ncbi:hypothetical protein OTK49_00835 [Vibrio coralliirubri]|uniref:5' nucleotidase, NT5C type n=1 Tax=Vibrio coralliirubri TaxID=1516159 RepID=UPI0022840215|nr:hypothetical protein [Vibrio coralliirubri]MCY9861076.1 hypothetical protein [Vibrio coralliirubri]